MLSSLTKIKSDNTLKKIIMTIRSKTKVSDNTLKQRNGAPKVEKETRRNIDHVVSS
jgi:hypothetical protein